MTESCSVKQQKNNLFTFSPNSIVLCRAPEYYKTQRIIIIMPVSAYQSCNFCTHLMRNRCTHLFTFGAYHYLNNYSILKVGYYVSTFIIMGFHPLVKVMEFCPWGICPMGF